jgi:hypothetical protein
MATIIPTLTLTANDSSHATPGPLSIALSLSATDSLTADGGVTCDIVTATTTHSANLILDASEQTLPAYVYIKNTGDGTVYLCIGDAGTASNQVMEIGTLEFAFFPWAAEVDYYLESAAGTETVEVWTFAQGA